MYHVVLNNTFHFTGWMGEGRYHPPKVETVQDQHITNVLPALFASQRELEMIEKKSYKPTRGSDGGCHKITVMVHFAQVIDENEAAQIQTQWLQTEEAKNLYELQLITKSRIAVACAQAAKQHEIDNRWYNKLWRSTTFYTGE